MSTRTGATAPEPVVLRIDKDAQENPTELAATIVTLIAHPDFAAEPGLAALMLEVGPRIERALGMRDLPPEFREAIETRMMLGAAASQFAITNPYRGVLLVPVYAGYALKDIVRRYEALEVLWAQRLAAGEVFRLLAEARRFGDAYVLPAGVASASIEQLSTFVMSELGVNETKNFTARVWRPSWRVAHLAAAIRSLDDRARARWGRPIQPPDLIFSPVLLRAVLQRAEALVLSMEGVRLRGSRRVADLIRLKMAA
jgi:hypothetical protein